jgi:hypothetical protein
VVLVFGERDHRVQRRVIDVEKHLEEVLVRVLRPARGELERCRLLAEDYLRAKRERREALERQMDALGQRVAAIHEEARAVGTGVVPHELTALEHSLARLLEDARVREEDEFERVWARMAPASSAERGPVPVDVDEALVFASDPAGIARAEAAIRGLRDAAAPWRVDIGGHTGWRVVPELHFGSPIQRFLAAPFEALDRALDTSEKAHALRQDGFRLRREVRARRQPAVPMREGSVMSELADAAMGHRLWEAVIEAQVNVPSGFPCAGMPFAKLPDPFQPMLTLWTTGYVVSSISETDVVLEALAVDVDPWPSGGP